MKKLLVLSIAVMTALILTACGDEDASGDGNLTIGISLPSATHGWMGALIDNAENQAQEIQENEGIDYVMTNAEDPNSQANDVDDLINQDVDVIVLLPIESAALSPVGQNVKDAGIPLVVVDRELENDAADVVVKGDNEGIGINAGEYFVDQLNGNGKVVEITGPPNSVTEQRGSGFQEAMDGEDGLEIVASQDGDFSTETSLEVMENILQSQPEIDAVFTQDDGMAVGVVQAINEAGREDIQFVTGAGGGKDIFEDIQDGGLISATFLYSPAMIEDGIKVAADIADGSDPEEEEVILEATEVNSDNVDEHYDPDSKF
ncbi:ribose transport system substrate-binding protein [Virgibacillus natechei]|uniref:Ribose transport system substrate-binding protein n=1 Tax=Virgibacillus natechei TaxID=1216297 RepID=A0ABS4IIP7_9BACI|nr:substrate-binding domain-containing protein [Virgibacillus natechei]MBP1970221.1 ribose transport system substrate-binding protein [Virgibacillus natechei]UZD12831.1 substrate-binding domain-containing protein [Virgibacillus natechei]